MNAVLNGILEAKVLPGAPARAHVSPVKLDTSALPGGSMVMLLFVDDEPEPRYVLRMPRTPNQPERLIRNYRSLQVVAREPRMGRSVPSPVYCGELGGATSSVETCVPGLPLAVAMRVARDEGRLDHLAGLFRQAAEWIWEFHTRCDSDEVGRSDHVTRYARRAIGILQRLDIVSPAQADWLLDVAVASDQSMAPAPRIHGDFNPNNTLLDEHGRLYVIDWEFSGPGWPLYDLFTLARTAWFHPSANVDPSPARAQALWDPRAPLGRSFGDALSRYEQRYGLARTDLRALFAVYVAGLVADQVEEMRGENVTLTEPWQSLLRAALHP